MSVADLIGARLPRYALGIGGLAADAWCGCQSYEESSAGRRRIARAGTGPATGASTSKDHPSSDSVTVAFGSYTIYILNSPHNMHHWVGECSEPK